MFLPSGLILIAVGDDPLDCPDTAIPISSLCMNPPLNSISQLCYQSRDASNINGHKEKKKKRLVGPLLYVSLSACDITPS